MGVPQFNAIYHPILLSLAASIGLVAARVRIGRFAALRGVTGEFAAGKLYVILGDNGAGKTTLLRTIAGLARPTRGKIAVLGSEDIKASRASIGYMAHPSLLYDEMSGMENLRYFARLYGIGGDARGEEVIRAVGLDPALARAVGTLAARVQREANVLAYIDGFWLCFWLAMAALFFVALITRAPPGPFTPAPFGFAKALMRRCGVSVP